MTRKTKPALPSSGGSYERQDDGSLKPAGTPAQAQPATAPASPPAPKKEAVK